MLKVPAHKRAGLGDLERPESLCMAPWVALHISAVGELKPCCEYDGSFGSANSTSISEYWNGSALAALRERLARGEEDPGCHSCAARSRFGAANLRDEMNAIYAHHESRVDATRGGESPIGQPVQLDLRFSNLCNLRCRTCWHGASSRWFEDAVKLPEAGIAGPRAVIRAVEDKERVFEFIRSQAEELEGIYFAGGEPLLMEEHYEILEELDRRGLHDVSLSYNTNFTEPVFRGIDAFELWSRFRRVKVLASVDGLGARGELIRKGASWERLAANRKRMKEVCPNVQFGVNTVISLFNVFHVPELQRRLHEMGFAHLADQEVKFAQSPGIYSIQILPPRMKRRAENVLRDHIRWLEQRRGEGRELTHNIEQFEATLAFMNAEDPGRSERLRFASFTLKLDRLRGEKLTTLAPELKPLLRTRRYIELLQRTRPLRQRLSRLSPWIAARTRS